jgi:hypothetical protein
MDFLKMANNAGKRLSQASQDCPSAVPSRLAYVLQGWQRLRVSAENARLVNCEQTRDDEGAGFRCSLSCPKKQTAQVRGAIVSLVNQDAPLLTITRRIPCCGCAVLVFNNAETLT